MVGMVRTYQLRRGSVQLRFDHVPDLLAQRLANALVEAVERVLGNIGIQAEHRRRVLDGLELLQRNRSDALRGRIRRAQLRVPVLQFPQLPEQPVVLLVGDLRSILDVVQVVVVPDAGAQLANPGLGSIPVHGGQDTRPGGWLTRGSDRPGRDVAGTGRSAERPPTCPGLLEAGISGDFKGTLPLSTVYVG
jgi:hypothetical protein